MPKENVKIKIPITIPHLFFEIKVLNKNIAKETIPKKIAK
jgi:hypothetical protein